MARFWLILVLVVPLLGCDFPPIPTPGPMRTATPGAGIVDGPGQGPLGTPIVSLPPTYTPQPASATPSPRTPTALPTPVVGATASAKPSPSATLRPSVVATANPTPVARPTTIVVYFSRRPQSDSDFAAVFPVVRTVLAGSNERLAITALDQLILGPTESEKLLGYFTELPAMLRGVSNCGGANFTLVNAGGTITVRFCRQITSAGVGQDARTQSQINATLRQFADVSRVALLTQDGQCLFDMSGQNLCLRP